MLGSLVGLVEFGFWRNCCLFISSVDFLCPSSLVQITPAPVGLCPSSPCGPKLASPQLMSCHPPPAPSWTAFPLEGAGAPRNLQHPSMARWTWRTHVLCAAGHRWPAWQDQTRATCTVEPAAGQMYTAHWIEASRMALGWAVSSMAWNTCAWTSLRASVRCHWAQNLGTDMT